MAVVGVSAVALSICGAAIIRGMLLEIGVVLPEEVVAVTATS